MSIVVDGDDQLSYRLPLFATKNKSERGRAMKVRLVAMLKHVVYIRLQIFTMTEEQTGANHIVQAIHRTTKDLKME